jgi:hypothetical protein
LAWPGCTQASDWVLLIKDPKRVANVLILLKVREEW